MACGVGRSGARTGEGSGAFSWLQVQRVLACALEHFLPLRHLLRPQRAQLQLLQLACGDGPIAQRQAVVLPLLQANHPRVLHVAVGVVHTKHLCGGEGGVSRGGVGVEDDERVRRGKEKPRQLRARTFSGRSRRCHASGLL